MSQDVDGSVDVAGLGLESSRRTDGGLLIGRKGQVLVLLLDRPQKGNAFDTGMLSDLDKLWRELAEDASVRAIVFGSTSLRFLCTGRDVGEIAELPLPGPRSSLADDFRLTWRRAGLWIPVICAAEGKAAGAGLHFALDADLVIAGRSAWFADTHVNVGLAGGLEVVGLLPKVGLGNALYLTLLGRDGGFDAQRALIAGLVQEVVDDGQALPRALELATTIAANSPSAVSRTAQAGWQAASDPKAQSYAWQLMQRQLAHPDAREGPTAWAQHRPPEWTL